MREHQISPEEKLLRLIRSPKRTSEKTQTSGEFNPELSAPIITTPIQHKHAHFSFSLDSMYRFLVLAMFVAGLILVINLYFVFFPSRPNVKPATNIHTRDTSVDANASVQVKPVSDYIQVVSQRDIFKTQEGEREYKNNAASVATDVLSGFTLVGVLLGDTPQAVIEDKKSQKTYYVQQGQMIDQFRVDEILEGKVILSIRNQRYEMSL